MLINADDDPREHDSILLPPLAIRIRAVRREAAGEYGFCGWARLSGISPHGARRVLRMFCGQRGDAVVSPNAVLIEGAHHVHGRVEHV
jgi:hypothetical protein